MTSARTLEACPSRRRCGSRRSRAPSRPKRSRESDHVLTKSDLATVEALRPGTALLVVLRGPNTGARFLLDDDEVMSGRHPDSDIFLDDVTVSRKHAIFRRTESGFVVRDVGSLNGTYVNRELVEEVVLKTGDEVQIGKFRLVFYASQAAASR